MNPEEQEPKPVVGMPGVPTHGRKYVVALVGLMVMLVLLALGAALTTRRENPRQPAKPTVTTAQKAVAAKSAIVYVTADGFKPATVTIASGGTVQWINSDTVVHQVAADPYPRDDSINGFDSTIQLMQNDTLNFTFAKPGTYTYHDEKNALTARGIIIVK